MIRSQFRLICNWRTYYSYQWDFAKRMLNLFSLTLQDLKQSRFAWRLSIISKKTKLALIRPRDTFPIFNSTVLCSMANSSWTLCFLTELVKILGRTAVILLSNTLLQEWFTLKWFPQIYSRAKFIQLLTDIYANTKRNHEDLRFIPRTPRIP